MKFRPFLVFLSFAAAALAADKPAAPATHSPWGDFVEKDFPFFSSVLDCRELGEGFPKDNLTPRGIILNLGNNLWACFDTDLLRIACIWEGEPGKPPVTPDALAPGSYHVAGQKTKDGQEYLPKPIGKVWLANGIYPGWQVGDTPSLTDPREPTPSKEEVGRGPLDSKVGQFLRVEKTKEGLTLVYEVFGVSVRELLSSKPRVNQHNPPLLIRQITVGPRSFELKYITSYDGGEQERWVKSLSPEKLKEYQRQLGMEDETGMTNGSLSSRSGSDDQPRTVTIKPGVRPEIIEMFCLSPKSPWVMGKSSKKEAFFEETEIHTLWTQTITTTATLSTKSDAYVIDDIPRPLDNPWKRNVRLADIAFLNDQGDAAGVTFDGDVWLISGLKGDLEKVTWKRFASGLHEPMSIVARPRTLNNKTTKPDAKNSTFNVQSSLLNVDLFVFDRNGIWKLVDTNNDKECDRYEMFCNLFAQTAETREFPNSMKLGPKGELFISKGGQEGTTYGKHNGTVIKIAADGKSMEVIGYGLRQPFIGVNPKTGLVTASDQQGNYVPSTPLHIISDHHFYGHLPTIAPKEKYPETITEPLTWMPHPVNPSGVTQTWLLDAKMGPLNDELIHIGYNRPELFRVLMNTHFEKPQAAVVSFNRNFDFPTLNAVVNPADGQLYVVGFQVWGTVVKKISGLARVRYTDKPRVLLKEVTPTDKGLLLRFNEKLDTKLATDPDSFNGERWNYKRTFEYGSPHLKLDGSSGQEWMTASSAYLSKDGMSVLVGFPDMKAGMHQMRIGWGLKSADGDKAENTAYFSPWELMTFDAKKEGFDENLKVDLTPRKAAAVATVKATAVEGERLYQMYGCMACHSTDGTLVGKVGPSWKGLYGSEREIAKGEKGKFKADEAYLKESITNPSAKVVKGFEKFDTGMPIYSGILNDGQIESLILYIKSLK
ncbi:cytochrome c [Prosthecobacter sp.]|uniref:c-type cytochrome n=1 Tax=Prosthecobacter sp. TaxID=1965333 RepID=UPI002487DCB8|nr:cytochrome c [Prosthecobacter sp.]MDI1314799.1 cytochrome c [Prosthecobacter sp.]